MSTTAVPAFWTIFTRLHPLGDSRRVTPSSWAQEEALFEILTDHGRGRLQEDPKAIRKRFDSLCTNRASKYRRRGQLEKAFRANSTLITPPNSNPAQQAVLRELAAQAEGKLSPDERRIFILLAQGYSIESVARKLGLLPSTLRSRIHRVRLLMRRNFEFILKG